MQNRSDLPPFHHQFLDFRDGFRGIQALRAGLGAVHDGVAAIEPERVFQVVQALAGELITAVHDPAVGLQQDRGPQITFAVPPVARATGGATGAQDALVQSVQLGAVFLGLQPFPRGRRGNGLQPGLDRGVLGVEVGQVRHQILDHRHVRQRIDLDLAGHVADGLGAGQSVGAVDVHRAGAAHAFAAGAPEGQGRVHFVLDLEQGIQHHRATGGQIDLVTALWELPGYKFYLKTECCRS